MSSDRKSLRERGRERREARRAAREARRGSSSSRLAEASPSSAGDEGRGQRRRRSPEVARQELLDAAERLFSVERPDDVGLKDVAREAGTSHALITHYFGTYAGLVEAVLQRRLLRLRERTTEQLRDATAVTRPDELISALFRTLGDPVHVRLMSWVIGHGRQEPMEVLALQHQGLQAIAHQVASALFTTVGGPPVPEARRREVVEKIELALVTAVASALGYALTKGALAGAIGRRESPELDTAVQRTLGLMLQAYMRELIA